MLMTTTHTIPGKQLEVIKPLHGYGHMFESISKSNPAFTFAELDIESAALKLKADAVVGMNYSTVVSNGILMVHAYGTAVKFVDEKKAGFFEWFGKKISR